MKIKTLKYNYNASGIIRKLQDQGYTIYRKNPRFTTDPNLVEWTVAIPKKYRDLAGKQTWFRILESEIAAAIQADDTLKMDQFIYPGYGWAIIFSLHNQDQDLTVCQRI